MYEPDPPAGGSLKAAYCSGVTVYGSVQLDERRDRRRGEALADDHASVLVADRRLPDEVAPGGSCSQSEACGAPISCAAPSTTRVSTWSRPSAAARSRPNSSSAFALSASRRCAS